jgi:hypothetical protein
MRFLTWCGRRDSLRIAPLINTAARFSVKVEPVYCNGLLDKVTSLSRYLDCIDDEEWVLCSDGYDCLYMQGEEEIQRRILQFGSNIIFSGQATGDHHLDYVVEACKNKNLSGPYPMLNSGVIAGRCGDLQAMLTEIRHWKISDIEQEFLVRRDGLGFVNDQTLFGKFLALHPSIVHVDSAASVSWTSAYENELVDEAIRHRSLEIRNPMTNECPCLLHLPCTSPGVYLQFLDVYSALGHQLSGDVVEIVRLERLCDQQSKVGIQATNILKTLRQTHGFQSFRARQYSRHYYRRCRILLSRLLRRIVPKEV